MYVLPALVLFALAVFGAAPTHAQTMYGSGANSLSGTAGGLFTIDQTTGVDALIADVVTPGGLSGLAIDSGARAYGTTVQPGGTSSLVRIDLSSGAVIGGPFAITVSGPGTPISIGDLAFQPGSDVLFASRSNADGGAGASQVYTIDVANGVASLVGSTTAVAGGGGLAFMPDGRLLRANVSGGTFILNSVFEISPSDATLITRYDGFPVFFDGLGVRPDGQIFATGGAGVLTVTLAGATASFLAPGPTTSMSDLDFLSTAEVPALSAPWHIALVSCLLLSAAFRRRGGGAR